MRSEKEIKEEIRKAYKRPEKECCYDNSSKGYINGLEWVLEGEPRYSIWELEKIFGKLDHIQYPASANVNIAVVFNWIRMNTEKVEKILEGKK